jgi:hypothetical protein
MARKHYVRDRGMSGLGWIGHVGLGQDEDDDLSSVYYGSDDAGNDYYVSSATGGIVNSDGISVSPTVPIYNDAGNLVSGSVAPIALPAGAIGPVADGPALPGASSGTGQTYYGVDSKGNDIWVNNSTGKFVNQDNLPITPAAGTLQVEGGGSVNVPAGATSTAGLTAGLKIASGALPALLAPGPAPRVAVPVATPSFLTASTIIPGVSNLMIIGAGLLGVMLLAGKK